MDQRVRRVPSPQREEGSYYSIVILPELFFWYFVYLLENHFLLVYLFFVFIISGVIKGFLGIGMPTAAMGFLTLVFDPIEAITLLIIPIVTTNFLQFKNSKYRYETMINYLSLIHI